MVHAVIFEVQPHPDQFNAYLSHGKALRPELERTPGFIENIRYASSRRKGTILSLSTWKNEKALVKWRTNEKHHGVQERGRSGIFEDYLLRVGEVILDSDTPQPQNPETVTWEKGDGTEIGDAVAVVLVNVKDTGGLTDGEKGPQDIVKEFGLLKDHEGLVGWDVFEAVLNAGDLILMVPFKEENRAARYIATLIKRELRFRLVRVVRSYGMYDRREAPQYYPDAAGKETIHAM